MILGHYLSITSVAFFSFQQCVHMSFLIVLDYHISGRVNFLRTVFCWANPDSMIFSQNKQHCFCVCHNEYQSVPPVQQCCFLLCFCDSFWTKVELCIAGLGYTVWDFRATHNSVLVGFNSLLLSAFLWNLQICICQILMKTWSQFGLLCLLNCCKNKFITWFYPKQSTFFLLSTLFMLYFWISFQSHVALINE